MRLVRQGAWLNVEVEDTPTKADLRLPLDAKEPFRIVDPQTGVAAAVRLRDAQESKAAIVAGDVVYKKAAPGHGDVVHRPSATGTEDFVLYEQKPTEEKLVYDVVLDERVRGLRLVANTLELLDEGGAPRLRVSPPYVIGNDGKRYDADLSVKGCAVDTNPAAPWGREPAAPGASECAVEVAWNERGVGYPAVVDPSWGSTRSMNVARYSHIAELLPNGKVFVAGGYNGTSSYLASAELYDPVTDTWAATQSMANARDMHAGVVLASGKVLVVGGYSSGGYLGSGEVYDPEAGVWLPTANSLALPRYYHSVVLLEDGRALIVGGSGASTSLSGAEIYSPATNSFSTTGSLTTARYFAAAVRLKDGRVLVAGGYGGGYLNLDFAPFPRSRGRSLTRPAHHQA